MDTTYDYGTESDSARYYFILGWEEILDNGRWTESETAFRKAMEFDGDWAVGKSLVGRITQNLEERQKLIIDLEAVKDKVGMDERILLDIFMPSMQAMNNRDQGISTSPEDRKARRTQAEANFRRFVHKYPEESYIKAEYIETLHANHGAKTALDSLNILASEEQTVLGFYISYRATLGLELGNTEYATEKLQSYRSLFSDLSYTTTYMLQAQILMAQDSLQKASELVNKVVTMDPNHLIAVGMQRRIKAELEKEIKSNPGN
ncbi:MAG: hypothetical protein HEP71_34530 [Roseivirga sp.]|nr:hypothetical protein [Roseivirga sp.]